MAAQELLHTTASPEEPGHFGLGSIGWRSATLDGSRSCPLNAPRNAIIRVLLYNISETLYTQRFGNDTHQIQPHPEMHQYTRDHLQTATGSLFDIAFGSNHDDVEARSKAIDIMQYLELLPDAALATRYATQLVNHLCEIGKQDAYEEHSMFTGTHWECKDWLSDSLHRVKILKKIFKT